MTWLVEKALKTISTEPVWIIKSINEDRETARADIRGTRYAMSKAGYRLRLREDR